jgi:L-fuconolactonase
MTSNLSIVDSQVHLWEPDAGSHQWPEQGRRYVTAPQATSSAERGAMRADELIAEMDRVGVDFTIVVPPVFAGDDNSPAITAAHRHPDRMAVMGRLTLNDPASEQQLTSWLDDPAMVGVRLTFFWEEHNRWLLDGTADWFWPVAERLDIPVAVLAPDRLREIADIARSHPRLRLIVDHFGMSLKAKDAEAFRAIDELVPLAEFSNVAVKASTLPSYVTEPYPFPSLTEPIRRVVEAFGARRVFWGSEMTRLPCPYEEAITHFTEHLDFLSPEDLEWVMGRGVRKWLRLQEEHR